MTQILAILEKLAAEFFKDNQIGLNLPMFYLNVFTKNLAFFLCKKTSGFIKKLFKLCQAKMLLLTKLFNFFYGKFCGF
jgi:hypothetical protein